jgi:hypothetical protein
MPGNEQNYCDAERQQERQSLEEKPRQQDRP